MTATLEPCFASEVYRHALEPHPRTRPVAVLRAVLDLWCACTGGTFELTAAGDAVVRRRSDGAEVLRIATGTREAAVPVLRQLAVDLARQSPDEFRDAWGLA